LAAEVEKAGCYLVVHPGAGAESRHWGSERWLAVMTRLHAQAPGHRIVLTGAGAADIALADELAARFPGIVNMAGRASWEEFVRILADASLVICPDTATGHVAALFGTPTVSLFTGTNSPARWAPYSNHVRVLTRPVLCAPCNRWGCEAMACFRGIEPDEVADAALAMLGVVPG
jgi:ADP-heptose:LPS heptosyltransferase